MATTFKWVAPEAIASAHTTSLNTLTNGSLSAASSTVDNETDLYEFINLELVLASLTPTGTPVVNVWVAYSTDGTNFDDGSVAEMELLQPLPLSTSASAKRVSRGNIPIRPLKFQLYVENKSGVSFAGSGNTLKYRRTNLQGV
jgi:hypothetical protein